MKDIWGEEGVELQPSFKYDLAQLYLYPKLHRTQSYHTHRTRREKLPQTRCSIDNNLESRFNGHLEARYYLCLAPVVPGER